MKDNRKLLYDILERIQSIQDYTQTGKDEFIQNRMIQDAVIRCFEVIGEAEKRLPESFKSHHSPIPWRRITGFRNIMIHNYDGVNLHHVWNTI